METNTILKDLLEISVTQLQFLTNVVSPDFRLEQAEYNKQKDEWEIVVSFLVENTNKRSNPIGVFASDYQYNRIYKKLRIDSDRNILGLYIFNNKE